MEMNATYTGVKELAAEANKQLALAGIYEKVTERTVRYYLSKDVGIIPQATEMYGTSSVFHEGHLYRILAAKRLQSAGLSIEFIRNLLQGKDRLWLEKAFSEGIEVFTDRKALNEFKKKSGRIDEEVIVIRDAIERKNVLDKSRDQETAPTELTVMWLRYKIVPGLEINLGDGFINQFSGDDIRRLVARIRSLTNEMIGRGGE